MELSLELQCQGQIMSSSVPHEVPSRRNSTMQCLALMNRRPYSGDLRTRLHQSIKRFAVVTTNWRSASSLRSNRL